MTVPTGTLRELADYFDMPYERLRGLVRRAGVQPVARRHTRGAPLVYRLADVTRAERDAFVARHAGHTGWRSLQEALSPRKIESVSEVD